MSDYLTRDEAVAILARNRALMDTVMAKVAATRALIVAYPGEDPDNLVLACQMLDSAKHIIDGAAPMDSPS